MSNIIAEEFNWSGRGVHAEFAPSDSLPFVQDKFLGRGAYGDVHKVICKGQPLAKKTVYSGRTLKLEDIRKEIDILTRLRHRHIVQLIGSFVQGRTVGLLLWPVAICDLHTLLTDLEGFPDR